MTTFDLVELGQGVFSFCSAQRGFGHSNVGLVIDTDGLTVIDTTATPAAGELVLAEVMQLTAELGLPIKRVVVTSSRVPFTGGSPAFWRAAFYGSEPVSDQLDQPANVDALRRLLPEFASAYHAEFQTRPVTHTIDQPVWITPAIQVLPLPGEGPMNLVVTVPAANVVFAGALASFGVTPLAYDGNPLVWADSLDQIQEIAGTVIPGHGLPGGTADMSALAYYLRACAEAAGNPAALGKGPWDDWTDPDFHAVNVERAALIAASDYSVPSAMLDLLGFG